MNNYMKDDNFISTAEKDMNLWLINAVIHVLTTWAVMKLKPEKNIQAWTGFKPMTSAILVQCSTNWATVYQAIWELVTLWVQNIPVEVEGYKWIYERSYRYIWTAEKGMNLWLINAVIHTTWAVLISVSQRSWVRIPFMPEFFFRL